MVSVCSLIYIHFSYRRGPSPLPHSADHELWFNSSPWNGRDFLVVCCFILGLLDVFLTFSLASIFSPERQRKKEKKIMKKEIKNCSRNEKRNAEKKQHERVNERKNVKEVEKKSKISIERCWRRCCVHFLRFRTSCAMLKVSVSPRSSPTARPNLIANFFPHLDWWPNGMR